MSMVITYIGVKNSYPDLTQKGDLVKRALLLAAKDNLPEARDRIKCSREYVVKIGNMVRYFYAIVVFIIALIVLDFD